MASAWDRFTLSGFSPSHWRGASVLYRLVGLFGTWRQGSALLQWADAIAAIFISIIFVFGPFVTTTLIGIWLLALALYWAILTVTDPERPTLTPIHLLVLLYWGIASVAVAFSPVKAAAFGGWVKLTLYLIFFAATSRVLRSPRLTNWIIVTLLLLSLVVSGYGIRQELFGAEQLATWNDPTSELAGDTRAYSYLGNPNLLAAYLLPLIALSLAAVFVWQGWLPKLLAVTTVLVNTACMYFTDSRGGWIGMLALLGAFFLLSYLWWRDALPPFWRKWLLPMVLGGFGAFILVAVLAVEPLRLRVMSIFAGREDSSNNFRMNVWAAVIDMIRDRPLIGIGPGNSAFNKIYPLYMSPRFSALSAYSVYLETAIETGLIGLSVFLWLIIVTINQGVRQLQRFRAVNNLHGFWSIAAIAGMVGLLAHGLVDTVWYRPQVNTLWWSMVALIASQYQPMQVDRQERHHKMMDNQYN